MAEESERTLPLAPSAANPSGSVWKNRYLIEKELGRGGFGVVYLARDTQLLSKPVVIKVLQDGASPDAYFQKKFQQEIEAMARIDHPGVVGVLDTGETPENKPFLVMQFVEGATLRTLISQGGMDLRQAARVLRQVGQALSAAHEKGVFHRDLKPENIMVQDLGEGEIQVKLIDFGIASVRDSQIIGSQTLGGNAQASKVVGTLSYMAPEQVMGHASGLSDVFALGVIAFEMLTGRRPEMTPQGVAAKPRQLRPEIPEAAEAVILKAVSYQPEQRQARPREFGEEMARALGAEAAISAPLPAVPAAPAASASSQGLEMAYVLFMDLVSYSMLPMDVQSQRIQQLAAIVRNTSEYRRASQANQIISLPTGDGMALVFFQNPVAPVQCAIEVSRELKNYPDLKLRMGVHTGPVYRIADINTNSNVAGGGINSAQRVMDCGDAGHILVSKTVSDILNQLSDWSQTLHDLGEAEVKHGVKMHVVNLVTAEVGNSEIPDKFKKSRALVEQMPSAPALPVLAAKAAGAGTTPVVAQPQAPAAYQPGWQPPAPAAKSHTGLFLGVGGVLVAATIAAYLFGPWRASEPASEPRAVPAASAPDAGGNDAAIPPAQPPASPPNSPPGAAAASSGSQGSGGASRAATAAALAAGASAAAAQTTSASSTGASQTTGELAQTPATGAVAAQVPSPAASAPPSPAPATNPAVARLRSEFATLAGRANSIRRSMGLMEQQQARQGVGMRGDMAAARDSMEYLLGEAEQSIASGDADAARQNLDLAVRQIEKLEGFLGR